MNEVIIPWDNSKRVGQVIKNLNHLRKCHKQITVILVTKPNLKFHTNKTGPQLIQEIRTTWQSTERLKMVENEVKNYREKVMMPLRLLTTPICLHTSYGLIVIPGDERKLAIEKHRRNL